MTIGSFLPWGSVGIFSLAGIEGDGVFTAALGVIAAGVALGKGRGPTTKVTAIICGLIGLFITWNIMANLTERSGLFDISIGSGLVLTALASIFLGIAGVSDIEVGWRTERSSGKDPKSESPIGGSDQLAELERLADLRDRGALSDEEFEQKKRDLSI